MKPDIGILVPDKEIKALIESLQHRIRVPLLIQECLVDEGTAVARSMIEAGVEVLMSRGSITHVLRTAKFDLPLIDLPVTGFDVLELLYKARAYGPKVGIVSFDNLIEGVQRVAPYLGMELFIWRVKSVADILRGVAQAREAGVDAVIGGIVAVETASGQGIPALLIHCSPDAVLTALREAEGIVLALYREREQSARRGVLLDSVNEALISYDASGNVIQSNSRADALFGPECADLKKAVDGIGLIDAVRRGERRQGELLSYKGVPYVCRLNPVLHNGVNLGGVAVIQELSSLQKLEARMRKKSYAPGNTARYKVTDLICASPETQRLVTRARNYAERPSSVIIQGESGTGKELFANIMHTAGPRRMGPFVAINCTALPENLLESELFGYGEGAFTGARKGGKPGLFELAHKGTLFLDEIGEISLSVQARLLRVLEEKAVRRLGEESLTPVDVRVVCATNRDLSAMVALGTFREDLFYRLNVLFLNIPPLRRRPEDLTALLDHFLRTLPDKLGRPPALLSPEAREELECYPYPGNVREMKNLLERLLITCTDGRITREDVRANLIHIPRPDDRPPRTGGTTARSKGLLQQEEERLILRTLEECGGNKAEAARRLGVSTTTLWRRARALQRDRTAGRGCASAD